MEEHRKLRRNENPQTSHESARYAAGKLATLQTQVFNMVKRNPNCTAMEIAWNEQLSDPRKVGRRLHELEKKGWILRLHPRRCSRTGRKAAIWIVR